MTFDSGTIDRYFAWDPQQDEEYRDNSTGAGTIGGKRAIASFRHSEVEGKR